MACTNKLPAHPWFTANASNIYLNQLKGDDRYIFGRSICDNVGHLNPQQFCPSFFPKIPTLTLETELCLAHPAPDTSPCGHCNCEDRQDCVPPLLFISIKAAVLHSHFLEITCRFLSKVILYWTRLSRYESSSSLSKFICTYKKTLPPCIFLSILDILQPI